VWAEVESSVVFSPSVEDGVEQEVATNAVATARNKNTFFIFRIVFLILKFEFMIDTFSNVIYPFEYNMQEK